jgi:hypothetical protein
MQERITFQHCVCQSKVIVPNVSGDATEKLDII